MADPGPCTRVSSPLPGAYDSTAIGAELDNLAGRGMAIPGYLNKLLDLILDVRMALTATKKVLDEHDVPEAHPKHGEYQNLRFTWEGEGAVRLRADFIVMDDLETVRSGVNVAANSRDVGPGGVAVGLPIVETWLSAYFIHAPDDDEKPDALILNQAGLELPLPEGYTKKRWVGFARVDDVPGPYFELMPFFYCASSGVYRLMGKKAATLGSLEFALLISDNSWQPLDMSVALPPGVRTAIVFTDSGVTVRNRVPGVQDAERIPTRLVLDAPSPDFSFERRIPVSKSLVAEVKRDITVSAGSVVVTGMVYAV